MTRPVLVLAGLVLVLGALEGWLARRETRARAEDRRVGALFAPEEAERLRKQPALRVEGMGESHSYGRISGRWRCLSYHQAPADARAIEALLDGIAGAEGIVHAATTEEAPRYGLNTPRTLRVSIQGPRAQQDPGGDVLATLELGASGDGRSGGFVRRKGTREIWSIASDLRAGLERRVAPGLPPLLEPAVVPAAWRESGGAVRIVLARGGERTVLERRDLPPDPETLEPGAVPWRWFLAPGTSGVEAEVELPVRTAEAFVGFLERLPYAAVLPPERRAESGVDGATTTVTLEGREGPPLVVALGTALPSGGVPAWVQASETLYELEPGTLELAFPRRETLTAPPEEEPWSAALSGGSR